MKKFIIITAIVMIVAFAASLALMNFTGIIQLEGENMELKDSKTVAIEGIEKMEISAVSEKITLHKTTDSQLKADLKLRNTGSNVSLIAEPSSDGKTVTVKVDHSKGWFCSFNFGGELDVYLPENYRGEMTVKNVSGAIVATEFPEISGFRAEDTSGRVEVSGFAGSLNSFYAKTVSGKIVAKNLNMADAVEAESTSGRIELYNLKNSVNTKTVSGAIDLNFDTLSGSVKAKSTSGRVTLNLPAESNAKIAFETVSGGMSGKDKLNLTRETRTFYEGTIGSGENNIDVNTVSGGLTIE